MELDKLTESLYARADRELKDRIMREVFHWDAMPKRHESTLPELHAIDRAIGQRHALDPMWLAFEIIFQVQRDANRQLAVDRLLAKMEEK